MSVVATFWSFRKTSSIDGHDADDFAEALVLELGDELLLVGAKRVEQERVLQDEARLPGEDRQDVELVAVEEPLHSVVADVEHALDVPLR